MLRLYMNVSSQLLLLVGLALCLCIHCDSSSELQAPACPNNCSNHGVCISNACRCNAGYYGNDCSVYVRILQSGVPISSRAGAWEWEYFLFENTQAGSISIDIYPTDTNYSDCDLYVRQNDFPNSIEWDYANIEWGTRTQLVIPVSPPARWYIGILANFLECPYTIVALATGSCPGGCGDHGTCNNGVCACLPGWAGQGCSVAIPTTSIAFEQPVSGNVETGGWQYHYLDLTQTITSFSILFNITSTPLVNHDCDIFVNLNTIPTLLDWLYQDSSITSYFTLDIPAPQTGRWYIGVWGFQQCQYVFRVKSFSNTCISACSKHGTCGPPCHCNAEYAGDYCQNRTVAVVSGVKLAGYVDQNTWNYYRYQADNLSQKNIVIQVNQTEEVADIDLYVKLGGTPTRWDYDFVDISTSKDFELVLTGVVSSTVEIGFFGWMKTEYQFTIYQSTDCQPACQHGKCASGICVCESGWSGADCSIQPNLLTSGLAVSGNLTRPDSWQYYRFISSKKTVEVTLREVGVAAQEQAGLLYLLVAEGRQPTLRVYDYEDSDLNKPLHAITIPLDGRSNTTNIEWDIGVYHTPNIPNPVGYKLVAWEA